MLPVRPPALTGVRPPGLLFSEQVLLDQFAFAVWITPMWRDAWPSGRLDCALRSTQHCESGVRSPVCSTDESCRATRSTKQSFLPRVRLRTTYETSFRRRAVRVIETRTRTHSYRHTASGMYAYLPPPVCLPI